MVLNRKMQHDILKALEEVYPDSLLVAALPGSSNDRTFMGNLFYLQEHGMIEGGDIRQPGQCRSMVDAQITRIGLDFLADDGGIRTILGRIQVKFDTNEIVKTIAAALLKSEMAKDKREKMVHSLELLEPLVLKNLLEELISVCAAEKHEYLWTLLFGDE